MDISPSIEQPLPAENRETFDQYAQLMSEHERLKALINAPELLDFLRGVHVEAVHQVERWGTTTDRAKNHADWFWLVGYLGGKALHAAENDYRAKALHHCISTAAALYNWHCAITKKDVRMCPGRSDIAEFVDARFPGVADVEQAEASRWDLAIDRMDQAIDRLRKKVGAAP